MTNIGTTIIEQLGGNKFLAMTGARCITDDIGVIIHLPRISSASCMVINLDKSADTYELTPYKGRGVRMTAREIATVGVQASELRATFTRLTGLDCTL